MKLVAVVGPTASGKSALALALAERFGGEVVSCDSTAVYRGLDIGTDKVPAGAQRGIPHHLVDVADPAEVYSAARYAADAASLVRAIWHRARLPILAGGTGFYYLELVMGLFPGPARDESRRRRLARVAARRGVEGLHRWVRRVDPESALRIQPRDQKRLIRALEVYLLTGRPLTAHFEDTASPIPEADVLSLGVAAGRAELADRVSRRVDEQFARGVVAEVRQLLAAGVPADAHAFSGLVYRQVLDLLRGVRDEAATRELIIRENLRYAKRQLTWFRHEPGVVWLSGPGDDGRVQDEAVRLTEAFLDLASAARPAGGPVAR